MQQARGFPHKSFFSASLPQPTNGHCLSVESPGGIQECGCSFPSLTLPRSPAQAAEKAEPPPTPSRIALCMHSALPSGTPLQTDRAHPATPTSHQSTFESHRLKDALVSQTPQKLVSQRCDILPPCPSCSRALQHCKLVPVAFCSVSP